MRFSLRTRSNLFNYERISDYLKRDFERIKAKIDEAEENYFLKVDQREYVEYMADISLIGLPEIDFDEVTSDKYEAEVPAEYFPANYDVEGGKTYKRTIIQFFIPCQGNTDMLVYIPNSMFAYTGQFHKEGSNIILEIIVLDTNSDQIRQRYSNELVSLQSYYDLLIKDIKNYNNELIEAITSVFLKRKEKITVSNKFLESIGVPLRKNKNIPSTFSVPKPKLREKIILKPSINEKTSESEPSLSATVYKDILKCINDVGKNFERMPSLYQNKSEENLRDHILMVLDPNFQMGSATGETFNRSGKTDIQLRYDSSVIFIAECKFWKGEKSFLLAIDQLLGYLTWRDTKASVIVFVQQKDFTTVLGKIKSTASHHSNYLSFVSMSDENWFNFKFHINDDRNREVNLAVQLYHLP